MSQPAFWRLYDAFKNATEEELADLDKLGRYGAHFFESLASLDCTPTRADKLPELLLACEITSRVPAPKMVARSQDVVGEISVRARTGLCLLNAFWLAMIRHSSDWRSLPSNQDRVFHHAISTFTNAAFRLLASEDWDPNAVQHFSQVLFQPLGILDVNNDLVPRQMTFYFIATFLRELSSVADPSRWTEYYRSRRDRHEPLPETRIAASRQRAVPVCRLLRPLIIVAGKCQDRTVYDHVMNSALTPLLHETKLGMMAASQLDPDENARRRICKKLNISPTEFKNLLERTQEPEDWDSEEEENNPPVLQEPQPEEEVKFVKVYMQQMDRADREVQDYMKHECQWYEVIHSSRLGDRQLRRQIFETISEVLLEPDLIPANKRRLQSMVTREKTRRQEEEEGHPVDPGKW